MIPYFEPPAIELGPLTIHAFGVLVAAAILVGIAIYRRRCEQAGLDLDVSGRLVTWVLVGGLLGAHLVDRLFYQLDETLAEPITLLMVWDGISSLGGLFGGALGGWLFFRRHPRGEETWRYVDAAAYALPFAFVIGRLGCFVAYDHVGVPTSFFLGQEYADGVVRHNLGLEEALYWIPLAGAMVALGRREHRPGFLTGALAVLYAPGRFLLDFLRIADDRYAGLNMSQYGSILVFVAGLWILLRVAEPALATPPRERPAPGLSPRHTKEDVP